MTNSVDKLSSQLAHLHLRAIQQKKSWIEIWEIIYRHPWFQSRLKACVSRTVRQNQLPHDWKDDIQQEAVLLFAKEIKKNLDLRYDPRKGNYQTLVWTILRRCCVKGIRQFKRTLTNKRLSPGMELPLENQDFDFDELYDFREIMNQLDEPGRTIVLAVCHGEAVEAIAQRMGQSTRTIYRHLEKSKQQLKALLHRTD